LLENNGRKCRAGSRLCCLY